MICRSPRYRREITAIIGPNGAGKTTVFNCLTGFYPPTVGRLALHPRRGERFFCSNGWTGFRIAQRAGIARTFQNIRLFAGMTVLENLIVAQHNRLMKASRFTIAGLLGLTRYRGAEKEAVDLARPGWTARADHTRRLEAGTLPYGDQRRLEIARAMCTEPRLLCLDEPAAGLNPREIGRAGRVADLDPRREKIGVLLIEHDMSVVMGISDHVVVLDYGRKIADGTPPRCAATRPSSGPISARRRTRSCRPKSSATSAPSDECMSAPMLKVSGVHDLLRQHRGAEGCRYGGRAGEIVTLIGANGAGKSTLLMTICGNPRARRAGPVRRRATSPGCRPTRSCGSASPSRRKAGASFRA